MPRRTFGCREIIFHYKMPKWNESLFFLGFRFCASQYSWQETQGSFRKKDCSTIFEGKVTLFGKFQLFIRSKSQKALQLKLMSYRFLVLL